MGADQYPKYFFVKLEQEQYQEGRLTLNFLNDSYSVEIDIVQKDSHKIYHHVDILYGFDGPQEAIDTAIQKLSHYLKRSL